MKSKKLLRFFILLAFFMIAGSFLSDWRAKKTENLKIKNQSETPEQKLKSFFDNPADYENISFETEKENRKVVIGIIPHHFLAKNLMAELLGKINPENAETIVVIGPDHFNKLENIIATSKLSWETPFGDLPADQDLIAKIISENISENNSPFYNEHSVYTPMPFMKKLFPQAKVVPLIIDSRYNFEKFYQLGKMVRGKAGEKTILIISSDFSHEASIPEAEKNDKKSIEALQKITAQNINNITCDCRNCLAFALGFAGESKKFILLDNKNSSDFEKVDQNITSYVAGYYIDEN